MIADVMATHLGQNVTLAARLSGIRPINAAMTDSYPHIIYKTVQWTSILALNKDTGWFDGKIRFHIVATTEAECQELSEIVKRELNALRIDATPYSLEYCRIDEEEDIEQGIDEAQKPIYVKAVDFIVRSKRAG